MKSKITILEFHCAGKIVCGFSRVGKGQKNRGKPLTPKSSNSKKPSFAPAYRQAGPKGASNEIT